MKRISLAVNLPARLLLFSSPSYLFHPSDKRVFHDIRTRAGSLFTHTYINQPTNYVRATRRPSLRFLAGSFKRRSSQLA
jgi:hypothetical protein